jgi:hypothetical protein
MGDIVHAFETEGQPFVKTTVKTRGLLTHYKTGMCKPFGNAYSMTQPT